MLSFDLKDFVCIIINLLILYIIAKKFIFGRVTRIIDARQQLIDERNAKAAAVQQEAEDLKTEYEKNLASASETSAQIVKEARDRARVEYNKILDRAANDAEAMKQSAQKAIDIQREKEMDELHAQIMDLAVETAGRIMEKQVSAEGDSALYDAFLKEAGDNDAKDE